MIEKRYYKFGLRVKPSEDVYSGQSEPLNPVQSEPVIPE
jgi:hypothetical protein